MKKNLLLVVISMLVLTGVCIFLWRHAGSDNEAYRMELEEINKPVKAKNKKPGRILTVHELRAQKLREIYKKPAAVSDKIKKIMNKANGLKFRERLALVNSLPRNLSFEDRQALYYYLKYEKNNPQTHCMKNDMLNILRDQNPPPEELTDVMLDLFYDKSQDMVVRCYALQHMRPWYLDERMQDPAIRQAFYDGLEEKENEIAGVALLALKYMSEHDTNFDKELISQKAAKIASDESTYILTRISAVSVCGKMQNPEVLPVVRSLSTDTSTSTTLRAAAIASLGEIGDQSDMATLQAISSSGKRPFATAAAAALKKLRKNINIAN